MGDVITVNKAQQQLRPESYFLEFFKLPALMSTNIVINDAEKKTNFVITNIFLIIFLFFRFNLPDFTIRNNRDSRKTIEKYFSLKWVDC